MYIKLMVKTGFHIYIYFTFSHSRGPSCHHILCRKILTDKTRRSSASRQKMKIDLIIRNLFFYSLLNFSFENLRTRIVLSFHPIMSKFMSKHI